MSGFLKWLGIKRKSKRNSRDEDALKKLQTTEKCIMANIEMLERNIVREEEITKKYAVTNKKVALNALKRKKVYEKQLEQSNDVMANVIQQRVALENAFTNIVALTTATTISNGLRRTQQNMTVNDFNNLVDDLAETNDLNEELSEIISSMSTRDAYVDEDELKKELEKLNREELSKKDLN